MSRILEQDAVSKENHHSQLRKHQFCNITEVDKSYLLIQVQSYLIIVSSTTNITSISYLKNNFENETTMTVPHSLLKDIVNPF